MLFSDMRCFSCGNPPEKTSLPQGEKLGLTSFSAIKGGFFDCEPYEHYSIRVCDSCLITAGQQGRIVRTETKNRPANIHEFIWNPDGEDTYYRLPLPKMTIIRKEES